MGVRCGGRGGARRGYRWSHRVMLKVMLVVVRGLLGIFRRLRRVVVKTCIIKTTMRMRQLWMTRR